MPRKGEISGAKSGLPKPRQASAISKSADKFAERKGREARAEGKKISKRYRETEAFLHPATFETSERDGAGKHVVVPPAIYAPPDSEEDQIRALKFAHIVAGQGGANSPFGKIQASDADFGWLLKVTERAKMMEYDRIFIDIYKGGTMIHANLHNMQQIYPEFFERRLTYQESMADIQKDIGVIILLGLRNKNDLDLIVLLAQWNGPKDAETGLPKVVCTPVFKLNFLTKDDGVEVVGINDETPIPAISLVGRFLRGPNTGPSRRGFGWIFGESGKGPTTHNEMAQIYNPLTSAFVKPGRPAGGVGVPAVPPVLYKNLIPAGASGRYW